MKYIYEKTGAIVDSPCELKGEGWKPLEAPKKKENPKKGVKKQEN